MVGFMKGLGCGCCGGCWTGFNETSFVDSFTTRDAGWRPHFNPPNEAGWESEWTWNGYNLKHAPTTNNFGTYFGGTPRSFCIRFGGTEKRFTRFSGPTEDPIFEIQCDVEINRPHTPSQVGKKATNIGAIQWDNIQYPNDAAYLIRTDYGRMGLVWEVEKTSTGVLHSIYAELWQAGGFGDVSYKHWIFTGTSYGPTTVSGTLKLNGFNLPYSASSINTKVYGYYNGTAIPSQLYHVLRTLNDPEGRGRSLCQFIPTLAHLTPLSAFSIAPSFNGMTATFDNFSYELAQ